MITLGLPVILAQLTQMLMMISDTVLVGRVGAQELAAVAVAVNTIFLLAVGVWMSLSAINPVVAHHLGAEDHGAIRRLFPQALWAALIVSLPTVALLVAGAQWLIPLLPMTAAEHGFASTYILVYATCIPGLMGYFAIRYFLEGLGRTGINLVVCIIAVPLNIVGNCVLIFGLYGAPKMGVAGAALMTAIVNVLMFVGLFLYVRRDARLRQYTHGFSREELVPDWAQLRALARIGLPMGGAVLAEVSAFTGLGLVMTNFGTAAVAAHQIVMNVVSTSFMVPLGLSAAIAARTGKFMGAGDPRSARFAAWTGISLGTGFMMLSALALLFTRGPIVSFYTQDAAVAAMAVSLLLYGVIFQVFDGVQVTTMGALRGLKDSTVPMLLCTFSYWVCGFAPALALAFWLGRGPHGIWMALPPCLLIASIVLTARLTQSLRRANSLPPPRPGNPASPDAEIPREEVPCVAGV